MVDIKGCLDCLLLFPFLKTTTTLKGRRRYPSQASVLSRILSTKQNPGASTGLGSRAGGKVCQG
jgi:hypothetical protein